MSIVNQLLEGEGDDFNRPAPPEIGISRSKYTRYDNQWIMTEHTGGEVS